MGEASRPLREDKCETDDPCFGPRLLWYRGYCEELSEGSVALEVLNPLERSGKCGSSSPEASGMGEGIYLKAPEEKRPVRRENFEQPPCLLLRENPGELSSEEIDEYELGCSCEWETKSKALVPLRGEGVGASNFDGD